LEAFRTFLREETIYPGGAAASGIIWAIKQTKYWQADDRQQTQLEWKAERKAIHSLNESSLPLRGRFSNISSVIWHENQPICYLESIGMNGFDVKTLCNSQNGF